MKTILLTAAITAAADLLSKLLSHQFLPKNGISIGALLQLRLTENTGMAFGLLSGRIWPLVLPPLLLLAGFFLLRNMKLRPSEKVSVGLIVGGFLGNWGERLFLGSVTDMIYFPWLPFFVCNIADIAICSGAVIFLFMLIFHSRSESVSE